MTEPASFRAGPSGAPDPLRPRRRKLAALRAEIAAMEGGAFRHVRAASTGWTPPAASPAPLEGEAASLAALQAQAGLHDVRPASYLDAPAAYRFAVRWLARLPADRLLVWVQARGDAGLDFGAPCPDGLAQAGLDPARVVRVQARPGAEALWAMEEAARAGALVLGEAGRASAYDLTASRRLHRAASDQGGAVLVLRAHDHEGPSAALTRWRIAAAPGRAAPWRGAGGLQGFGAQRLDAVLERRRGGAPDHFELEWDEYALRSLEPAALADRTPARARAV